jgi:2-dehydro-3-deoxygluconokinase
MAAMRADRPLRLGGSLALSIAGSEGNVAIGLRRLGHTVTWVGRVGDDELGALVRRTLRAEGVDVHAAVDVDAPTGALLFEQRLPDVVRVTYLRSGSAATRLSWSDVRDALVMPPRVLHVSGITTALGAGPREVVHRAVRTAHEAGAVVTLDINYRSRLGSREQWAAALEPVIRLATVVVGTEDELRIVGGVGLGVPEVLVTYGADGAALHTAAGVLEQPAVPVRAVDPVGAGDAFVAGYLSGMLDDLPAADRLRRAVTLGAFAVSTIGDWEGLPDRSELALLDAPPGSALR